MFTNEKMTFALELKENHKVISVLKDIAKVLHTNVSYLVDGDENEIAPEIMQVDFSSVLVQIDRFISPVYEALLREAEFFGMWSSKENVWR